MRKAILFICFTLLLVPAFSARKALIIGNAAYTDKPLKNPVNDARLVEKTMKTVGYQTRLYTNLDGESFDRAILDFVREINYSDEVFFYYSGHGLQINGENYLLPVKENIFDDVSAQRRGISLKDDIMRRLERARLQIIVLDACRDNPFSSFRSSSKGLAQPPAEAKGYFILYSTSANSVADDGIGDNSDFTKILCKYIETPGMELNALGKRVGREVNDLNRNQYPDMFTRFYDDYYFVAPKPPEPVAAQTPPLVVANPANQPVQTTPEPVITLSVQPPQPPTQQVREGTAATQPVTVAQLSLPRSESPNPTVKDTSAPKVFNPQSEMGAGQKVVSRLRYGVKLDGGLDKQPYLYPVFNEGTYQLNGDLYALWQYRQAWLKAGLTSNYGDYDYPPYHIADISARIPLWIADLHAGFQSDLQGGMTGFDLRLEKALKLGAQRLRGQLGLGVFSGTSQDSYQFENDLYDQYYNGYTLYDRGIMGMSSFQPTGRFFAQLELGNHAQLEDTYHQQTASLPDLPLINASQGAYQLSLAYANTILEEHTHSSGSNFFYIDGDYWIYNLRFTIEANLVKLGLAWKPWNNFEVNIHYTTLEIDHELLFDGVSDDSEGSVIDLCLNSAYSINISPRMTLIALLGYQSITWDIFRSTQSNFFDIDVERAGIALEALTQYRLTSAMTLHAKLGVATIGESYAYYKNSYSNVYEQTLIEPKFAIGIDWHFDKPFYRK